MKIELKNYFNIVSAGMSNFQSGSYCIMLLIFSFNFAVGQAGFNKTYNAGRSLWLKDIEWHDSADLVISGGYFNDSSNFHNLIILKVDTTGEIISSTEISDPLGQSHLTIQEESKFIVNDLGQIVLPFAFYNRSSSMGLAMIDAAGDLQSIFEYPSDTGNIINPFDILQITDGYLITGWYSRPPLYKTEAFVMKIDGAGGKQWIKMYGSPNYHEVVRSVNKINSNLYILSGGQINDVAPKFERGWAVFIDSLGNDKSEWIADTNHFHEHGLLSLQYDATTKQLVYLTYVERQTNYPGEDYIVTIPILMVRDTSMNMLSFNEYGPYAVNHYLTTLNKSRNGGWIGTGRTTLTTDDYSSPVASTRGRVIRVDDNLDLAWSVTDTAFFHSEYGSRCYISGLTEAPSQSIYAVGGANKYLNTGLERSYGWILKISPDGCVDTICTSTSIIEKLDEDASHFNLFPNPTSDNITLEVNSISSYPYYFELFDIYGQKKLRSKVISLREVISLGSLTAGIYIWAISDYKSVCKGVGKLIIL